MYVTPLSPVLEESLKPAEQHCISILHTADATTLKDFIIEKIIQGLLNNETCLIIMDDDQDLSIPAKILSTYKLAHLCLLWNESTPISDRQIDRFKILNDLAPLELLHSYDQIRLRRKELKNRIRMSLDSLREPVFFRKSVKSLLHRYERDLPSRHFDMRSFDSQFDQIEETVNYLSDLESLFKQRFIPILSSTGLPESIYSTAEAYLEGKKSIQLLYNKLLANSHRLIHEMQRLKNKVKEAIYAEYIEWNEIFDKLQSLYYDAEDLSGNVSFDKKASQLVEALYTTHYLKFDDLHIRTIEWDHVPEALNAIKTYMDRYPDLIEQNTRAFFNRLTPFNTEDSEFKEALDQSQETLLEIMDSEWIDLDGETEFLHVIAIMEKVEGTLFKLRSALSILRDQEFIEFSRKRTAIGLDVSWIKYFYENPDKGWVELYINQYYGQALNLSYHPDTRLLSARIEEYLHLLADSSKTLLKEIHNKWCKKKTDATFNIKRNNPNLYKSLFESGQTSLTLGNLYYNDHPFLQSYYPLLCIHKKDISTIFNNSNCTWDHVIFLNPPKTPVNELSVVFNQVLDIYLATSYDIEVETILEKYPSRYFYSAEQKLEYAQPFELLQRTDKFKQALALASCVMSIAKTYNVYQLRNKSFISLLNDELNNKIFQALPQEEFNVLYERVSDVNEMVEALIVPDSEIHFLYEDHLIDPANIKTIDWQIAVLNLLKQAGVQMHNIQTKDLFMHYSKTIETASQSLYSKTGILAEELIV